MKKYFTSDPHLNHCNILTFEDARPFATIEEHNETIVENWNSVVNPEDIVYIIGDFMMGKKTETIPTYMPRLKGIKILVYGNHDSIGPFAGRNQKIDVAKLYFDNGIAQILPDHYLYVTDPRLHTDKPVKFYLNHFPPLHRDIKQDHTPEGKIRYRQFRPKYQENCIHLCGHLHSKSQILGPDVIHVGVDSWNYTPVSLDEILDMYAMIPYQPLIKTLTGD